MAGTVYPYNYQDMPIREIPDGFSYHMFARRPSIPFFTQAIETVSRRTRKDQHGRGPDADAHLTMSPAPVNRTPHLEPIFHASEGADPESRIGETIQGVVDHDRSRIGFIREVPALGEQCPMLIDIPS